ncbi:MAG: hypothetical protein RSE41_03070 [Clostridia bacterium]
MFKNTLDDKPLYIKPNGEEIIDLTQTIFNFENNLNSDVNVFRLNKTYNMRPDLISYACFNSTDQMELILKVNGISNPFSINEDDIIIVPSQEQLNSIVKPINNNYTGDNTIRQAYKYIDPSKFPNKSDVVKDFENRTIKSDDTQILPPNISQKDESQYEVRNGRVYFGENIGQSCLKSGMTLTDYMKTIIKN